MLTQALSGAIDPFQPQSTKPEGVGQFIQVKNTWTVEVDGATHRFRIDFSFTSRDFVTSRPKKSLANFVNELLDLRQDVKRGD